MCVFAQIVAGAAATMEAMQLSEPDRQLHHHGRSTLISDIGGSLTTKLGGVFALCAEDGDIDDQRNPGYGLFFHDTRFLNRARLRVGGARLSILLSHADRNESLCELTNPQLDVDDRKVLDKDMLGIRRQRRLGRTIVETIRVVNYGSEPVDLPLVLEFDADFASMFTVRGADQGRRGSLHEPRWHHDKLLFRYDGADGHVRTTTIGFEPGPDERQERRADFRLRLESAEEMCLEITIDLDDRGKHNGVLEPMPPALHPSDAPSWSSVETDNPLFDRTMQRSMADLEMLAMRERGDVFFAGGVPWYVALFGRDSLITAMETLSLEPRIAARTLELLAQYQGTDVNDWREEEPGKILHELRVGEKANLHEVPQTPYYGTVDATPLFVIVLSEYLRWTGDLDLWNRLRGNVERALAWIDHFGDHDGDGFLDYRSTSHKGMDNQGWKDSGNSVRNRDGSLATPPIALVEVQGYVYRAKVAAAELYRREGDEQRASKLEAGARDLRRRFRDAYWMEDRGTLAEALQQGGKQAQAITSNPGQALWGGIVDDDHANAVVRSLMDASMDSGWGIRTLAEGEAAYNPIDYQVGSVWPHDNALIAAGLKQYGYHEEAIRVFSGIYRAATLFPLYRLPEVFAGFSKTRYPRPVRYPVACSPQAWAAGSLPYLLQTILGLRPNALDGVLHIVQPSLPDFLGQVVLRGLRVGKSRLDLRYQRTGAATLVAVERCNPDLQVTIQY